VVGVSVVGIGIGVVLVLVLFGIELFVVVGICYWELIGVGNGVGVVIVVNHYVVVDCWYV
jgi:hypothetical protein